MALDWSSWRQTGYPVVITGQHAAALYTFDERAGDVIHDKSPSGVDLSIPETYQVMDKIALQPFWTEFEMSGSYWRAVLKNVVGFIPFGFCFYPLVSNLLRRRAPLTTIALGTAASFLIEFLQIFLPTRDSGTTDLITNTLGTSIGVAVFRAIVPTLVRLLPRLKQLQTYPAGVSPRDTGNY